MNVFYHAVRSSNTNKYHNTIIYISQHSVLHIKFSITTMTYIHTYIPCIFVGVFFFEHQYFNNNKYFNNNRSGSVGVFVSTLIFLRYFRLKHVNFCLFFSSGFRVPNEQAVQILREGRQRAPRAEEREPVLLPRR